MQSAGLIVRNGKRGTPAWKTAFYLAYGFRPLEEFPDLWDPQNPALQMIKTVAPHSA